MIVVKNRWISWCNRQSDVVLFSTVQTLKQLITRVTAPCTMLAAPVLASALICWGRRVVRRTPRCHDDVLATHRLAVIPRQVAAVTVGQRAKRYSKDYRLVSYNGVSVRCETIGGECPASVCGLLHYIKSCRQYRSIT